MPHLHFMMDAYGSIEEHANNIMAVYELLNTVAEELELYPVMPPFLVPYYYGEETEDGGISAFVICKGGHITIHTFPYRSCYFVDVLTDEFFTANDAETIFLNQLHAENTNVRLIDRRTIYSAKEEFVNESQDFGPHYMIEVDNIEMTMESIYKTLDSIAEKINMKAITRPYVLYDNVENPNFISGVLVVAQSHIAIHYDINEHNAYIDIFSCAFLSDEVIRKVLKDYFPNNFKCKLFSRGSKHNDKYKRKETRIKRNNNWQKNIN